MKTKRCSKCKLRKALCEFHKRKRNKDGLRYWCKECQLAYKRKRYEENRGDRKRRIKHGDSHRVVNGVKQKRCKKCEGWKDESEFGKDRSTVDGLYFYCKNCDSVSAQKYYQAHQDEIKANTKAYYKTHRVEHGKCAREYYEVHKAETVKYQKEYGQTEIGRSKHHKAQKKYSETIIGCLRRKYAGMMNRCNNENHLTYKWYGGRGIEVKFQSANEFIDYVVNVLQVNPIGLSVHRIDPDGDYCCGNIEFILSTDHIELHRKLGAWK